MQLYGVHKTSLSIEKPLRQVHKLSSAEEVDHAFLHSASVLNVDNSESSASSESEISDDESTFRINVMDQHFSSDEDGDNDWVEEMYISKFQILP